MLVRPWDVTEYVEQGSADIGIVGLDVLAEKTKLPTPIIRFEI